MPARGNSGVLRPATGDARDVGPRSDDRGIRMPEARAGREFINDGGRARTQALVVVAARAAAAAEQLCIAGQRHEVWTRGTDLRAVPGSAERYAVRTDDRVQVR